MQKNGEFTVELVLVHQCGNAAAGRSSLDSINPGERKVRGAGGVGWLSPSLKGRGSESPRTNPSARGSEKARAVVEKVRGQKAVGGGGEKIDAGSNGEDEDKDEEDGGGGSGGGGSDEHDDGDDDEDIDNGSESRPLPPSSVHPNPPRAAPNSRRPRLENRHARVIKRARA
jgi:hypothetical protein